MEKKKEFNKMIENQLNGGVLSNHVDYKQINHFLRFTHRYLIYVCWKWIKAFIKANAFYYDNRDKYSFFDGRNEIVGTECSQICKELESFKIYSFEEREITENYED